MAMRLDKSAKNDETISYFYFKQAKRFFSIYFTVLILVSFLALLNFDSRAENGMSDRLRGALDLQSNLKSLIFDANTVEHMNVGFRFWEISNHIKFFSFKPSAFSLTTGFFVLNSNYILFFRLFSNAC
jgi:peptidoglycan/LPS O-acetylase OafA/YrhL